MGSQKDAREKEKVREREAGKYKMYMQDIF